MSEYVKVDSKTMLQPFGPSSSNSDNRKCFQLLITHIPDLKPEEVFITSKLQPISIPNDVLVVAGPRCCR